MLTPRFSGFFRFYFVIFAVSTLFLLDSCRSKGSILQTESFENGKLKSRGHLIYGVKTGFWDFYLPNGLHDHREKWSDGKLRWTIYYTPKHRKAKIIDENGKVTVFPDCGCSP